MVFTEFDGTLLTSRDFKTLFYTSRKFKRLYSTCESLDDIMSFVKLSVTSKKNFTVLNDIQKTYNLTDRYRLRKTSIVSSQTFNSLYSEMD